MSRHRHRRRGRGRGHEHEFDHEFDYDGEPRPPQRTIEARGGRRKRRVNTEVHDAFRSLGADDRTGRLTDREFDRQVVEEVGYLFRKSGSHFGNMCRSIGELFSMLF